MSEHTIAQQVEFVGEWFLPDQEAAPRVSGTLKWSASGATAKLHQPLTPLRGAIYGGSAHSYPAIHGTTIDSKLISVLDAMGGGAGFTIGSAGFRQTETIVSSCVVVGGHVGSDANYSEMTASIPGLQLWIGRTGVTQTILQKSEAFGPRVVYCIEGLPEEETLIPNLRTKLGWGINRSFSGDLVSEIAVKTSASLRIQPAEPQNLKWFVEQRERFFPMPDFDLTQPERVLVALRGRILDERYTRLLMAQTSLDLSLIILLDKVQKGQRISAEESRQLKAAKLVEGRYPNLMVAGRVAAVAGHKAQHIRNRGFDSQYYRDMIIALVRTHPPVSRDDIDRLLLDKLPEVLTQVQKVAKVHNLISSLSGKVIQNVGTRQAPQWVIVEQRKQ